MRADVSMEATRSKQSVQQGRDKHQATATPNATYPGGGERENATKETWCPLSHAKDQTNFTGSH